MLPLVFLNEADLNEDGEVNFLDISPFIVELSLLQAKKIDIDETKVAHLLMSGIFKLVATKLLLGADYQRYA